MKSSLALFQYCRWRLARPSGSPASLRRFLNSCEEGFSLLEMVVVLAILGILVSIQLPNVLGNSERAKVISAQAKISSVLTECALARQEGYTELELNPSAKQVSRGQAVTFFDLIPSADTAPSGYKWVSIGCSEMSLFPVDSNGTIVPGKSPTGFPRLYAKISSRGRLVKVADVCQPVGSIDSTSQCIAWDSSIDRVTWRTGRDLSSDDWSRRSVSE